MEKMIPPVLYGDVPSFMGARILKSLDEVEKNQAVIVGLPFDGVATFRGGATRRAPQEIRKMSLLFDSGYNYELEKDIGEGLNIVDLGDLALPSGDMETSGKKIVKTIGKIINKNAIPIIMGGDHAITYPVFRAVINNNNKSQEKFDSSINNIKSPANKSNTNTGLIIFDTHLDLVSEYEKNRFTRASPLIRIIELTDIKPDNIVIFGVRGFRNSKEEIALARELGIKVFSVQEIASNSIKDLASKALKLANKDCSGFYISLDIDVVDPCYAPGTNSPSPGGLTSREIIELIQNITKDGFLGLDIVEVAPEHDPCNNTSLLAARIIGEALCGLI